jgi:hypothetical protein
VEDVVNLGPRAQATLVKYAINIFKYILNVNKNVLSIFHNIPKRKKELISCVSSNICTKISSPLFEKKLK